LLQNYQSFSYYQSFYSKYNVNMKNKKMYSLRIHSEQLEYLRKKAKNNFTTVTQLILDLVNKDMKNKSNNE